MDTDLERGIMNLSGVRLYVKSSVELTVDLTVNLTTDTRLRYAENRQ